MKKFLLFVILSAFFLSISICATNKLSPAIDVLAHENSMIKAGVLFNGELNFDVDDFDSVLGTNVQAITITSLPSDKNGRLMLDNLYVLENQVISRSDFSMLKYVSTTETDEEVFFTFKPKGSNYSIKCELKSLKSVNLSPVATNGTDISAWTNQNTSYYGVLKGYDPEGDSLKYEICSYPSKGIIYLNNKSEGDYRYVPYSNARGTDSFTYKVRDSYGEYSETCTVTIKIENLSSKPVIADLDDERYLNAIMVIKNHGLMSLLDGENSTQLFKPDEAITREEFLVLVMRAMGAKKVPSLDKTRFADDKEISNEYKGYIESAVSLGIISGEIKNDGLYFNPQGVVTVADAAIIINRIIGAEEKLTTSVFVDDSEIPAEAKASIKALCDLGILSKTDGKILPNTPLTRAQTAKILMSLLEFRGKIK